MSESLPASLFAETQQMVVNLTNEVGRLRNENQTIKLENNSISGEVVSLRRELQLSYDENNTAQSAFAIYKDDMKLLIQRMEDKNEKYKAIIDLMSLAKIETNKELELSQQHVKQLEKKNKELSQQLKEKEIIMMKEREQDADRMLKMKTYASLVEEQVNEQHSMRVEEVHIRKRLEESNQLLRQELSLMKVLAYSKRGHEEPGLTMPTTKKMYSQLKNDLRDAAKYMNDVLKKYENEQSTPQFTVDDIRI